MGGVAEWRAQTWAEPEYDWGGRASPRATNESMPGPTGSGTTTTSTLTPPWPASPSLSLSAARPPVSKEGVGCLTWCRYRH